MKKILTSLTITSIVMLAGCASDRASVNVNAGNKETQKQNENTEVVVNVNDNTNLNSNTNAEVNTNVVGTALELSENTADTEIDTSDWLTYTNEEYGFSFKYPSDYSVTMNDAVVGNILDPTSTLSGKMNIENSELFSGMSEREILMTEPEKEIMPLIEERFLTINTLPAYRSIRQLKKGELLYPTAKDSTERTEETYTEIEYRYEHNNNLIRFTFNIEGENYQNFYEIIDIIGQSFSI